MRIIDAHRVQEILSKWAAGIPKDNKIIKNTAPVGETQYETLRKVLQVIDDAPTVEAVTKEQYETEKENNRWLLNARWIPITLKFPPDDDLVMLSFENYSNPCIGYFKRQKDGSGNFYTESSMFPLLKFNLFVNAWQPLPECYRED